MKNRRWLAGLAVAGVATILPAWAAAGADAQAVMVQEGGQEYALPGKVAAKAQIGATELNCSYQPASAGEKSFHFADGNSAVFSANGIRFVTPQGAAAVADSAGSSWWCQADGLVVFTPQAGNNAAGEKSAVKVELYSSAGARITELRVSAPPHGAEVSWTYEYARPVDDCLGMTFRVQSAAAGHRPAQHIEYKLCPAGA